MPAKNKTASTWAAFAFRAAVLAVMPLALQACANKENGPEAELGPGGRGGGAGAPVPGTQRDFAVNVGDIVYFSTDSTDLTPEAQQTLTKQSQWLRQYPQFTITIEGHADERGTREYNISLSARRATATRAFLVAQGIDQHRISSIAYGKERPAALCDAEQCWSQNRRAVTVITGGAKTS